MKKLNFGRIALIAAAAVDIVGSVCYVALDGADRTFSLLGFILALAGAASTALAIFTDLGFTPIVPSALYSAAFALVLRVALPSLSDVWNKVNFIGGNAAMGMTFAGIYFVCAVTSVAATFRGIERI